MKRLTILLVVIALGAIVQSCQDASFNELEQTVLEHESSISTDNDREIIKTPGSN